MACAQHIAICCVHTAAKGLSVDGTCCPIVEGPAFIKLPDAGSVRDHPVVTNTWQGLPFTPPRASCHFARPRKQRLPVQQGCAKYRFYDQDLGTLPNSPLPRLLDMGQVRQLAAAPSFAQQRRAPHRGSHAPSCCSASL